MKRLTNEEYEGALQANPMAAALVLDTPRRERTPEEESEWVADKRAEYEADRICGDLWSNC
jgi:hypothetical protein